MSDQPTSLTSKSFHVATVPRPTTTELNDNDLANERDLIARGEAKMAAAAEIGQTISARDIPLAAYVYNMMG